MDANYFKKNVGKMQYQRNVLTTFCFIVLLSNLLLVLLALTKRERIIIVPPTIEKEFWIEGKKFSPTYLEQFGIFLAQLLLNKSPESVSLQNRILLRFVAPDYYPIFKKALEQEKNEMIEKDLSYIFFPDKVQVLPERKQIILEGNRLAYLGTEEFLNETQRYILNFSFARGSLLLKELVKEEIPQ
ncbi:MAG: hypothetical protein K1000chlam3_00461 [Chlamydiae bacterium]|nr:hypothetical protein [Chlamydiota bacterium]